MQENKTPELEDIAKISIFLDEVSHISEEGLLDKNKVKYQRKIEALARVDEPLLRKYIDNSRVLTGQQIYLFKEAIFTSNDEGSDIGFSVYFGFIGLLALVFAGYKWDNPNSIYVFIFSFVFIGISLGTFFWQYYMAIKKLKEIKSISQRLYIEMENKKLLLDQQND